MEGINELNNKSRLKAVENPPQPRFSLLQRSAIAAALLIIAFLAGLIPAWLSGRETTRQLGAAQANLRTSQLQNRLASAAISAKRGEYEPARVAASDFFTDLRAEIDRPESAFSVEQGAAVRPILEQRDQVITQLARDDAGAAENLMGLYVAYVQAVSPAAAQKMIGRAR
jgi:hypothetical protein